MLSTSLLKQSLRYARARKPPSIPIVKRTLVDFPSISQAIQTVMQTAHTTYGLPWWATIASSTIFVRTALFPLVKYQILASRKLSAAIPEISFLFQLTRNRLATIPIRNNPQRMEVLNTFFKGMKATFVLHEVSFAEILFYPLVNLSVFVTFVYSVRDMVINGHSNLDLDEGGLLWFKDLSDKDRSYVLPLLAIAISYSGIEFSLGGKVGKILLTLKDIFQSLMLISMPFISSLPAGVFCYWIPSSAFGIAQSAALKNARFQKFFGIPPMLKPGTKAAATGSTTVATASVATASTAASSAVTSTAAVAAGAATASTIAAATAVTSTATNTAQAAVEEIVDTTVKK
jgi:YidC/Oxa1 family membrane protein insertase